MPPVPQLQAPLRQRSAVLAHIEHMLPPVPHWVTVSLPSGTQAVPLQQPLAQLVESQMHWPPEHRWPTPQAAIPPQVHRPVLALHPSALAPQAVQVLPAAPHWFWLGFVTHTPPEQQPVGQLMLSHWQVPETQR